MFQLTSGFASGLKGHRLKIRVLVPNWPKTCPVPLRSYKVHAYKIIHKLPLAYMSSVGEGG